MRPIGDYVTGRFAYLTTMFHVHAMSFDFRAHEARPRRFTWKRLGWPASPRRTIFFTDDRPENVAGAQAAGFDAVLFTTPAALVRGTVRSGGLS